MLSSFNRFSESWAAKILLAILIVSFGVFWGIGNIFQKNNPLTYIAHVGDHPIETLTFQKELQRRLAYIQQMIGRPLSQKEIIAVRLPVIVLQDLMNQKAMTLFAEKMGLVVSDKLVQEHIRSQPAFQDKGRFSRERFLKMLRLQRMTEPEFLKMTHDALVRGQLEDAVRSLTPNPLFLRTAFVTAHLQERTGKYLYLKSGEERIPEPTQKQLQNFYETSKESFRRPAEKDVTFLALPKDVLSRLASGKQGGAYENFVQELLTDAEDFLAGGGSLSSLANRYAVPLVVQGGLSANTKVQNLSTFKPFSEDARQEILEKILKLSRNAGERVERLKDGTVLIYAITQEKASYHPPLQEIRAQILQKWKEEQDRKAAYQRAQKLAEKLNKNPRLITNLSLRTGTGALSDKGQQQLPAEVKTALFSAQQGEWRAQKGVNGGAYVVYLEKIHAPGMAKVDQSLKALTERKVNLLEESFLTSFRRGVSAVFRLKPNPAALALFMRPS
jgi:peptidyl-prolyl cis-trans isomerase D